MSVSLIRPVCHFNDQRIIRNPKDKFVAAVTIPCTKESRYLTSVYQNDGTVDRVPACSEHYWPKEPEIDSE